MSHRYTLNMPPRSPLSATESRRGANNILTDANVDPLDHQHHNARVLWRERLILQRIKLLQRVALVRLA